MDHNIDRVVTHLFDEEVLEASGTATSAVVDMQKARTDDFSIQYKFKTGGGTGTAKIEVTESINGSDWEENSTDIASGLTLAGNASDIVEFTAGKGAAFIKIIITETGGAAGVTLSVWLCTR